MGGNTVNKSGATFHVSGVSRGNTGTDSALISPREPTRGQWEKNLRHLGTLVLGLLDAQSERSRYGRVRIMSGLWVGTGRNAVDKSGIAVRIADARRVSFRMSAAGCKNRPSLLNA
jgi:hypothetical protein